MKTFKPRVNNIKTKKMKTINFRMATTSFLALVLACSITGCSLKKRLSDKSRSSIALEEEGSLVSNLNESSQGNRMILVRDSNDHQYKVTISPMDTFTFSMEKGFRGKASRIEVAGNLQRKTSVNDSSTFSGSRQSLSQKELIRKVEGEQLNSSKTVTKLWIDWWWLLAGIGLGVLLTYLFCKMKWA